MKTNEDYLHLLNRDEGKENKVIISLENGSVIYKYPTSELKEPTRDMQIIRIRERYGPVVIGNGVGLARVRL